MKKKDRKQKSIVPTLIAGLTATVLGYATYTMIRGDKSAKKVEPSDSKKKQERMFI
ncbi:hypothetical protein N6H18_10575 [Reichenbachiella agarivorans]|uniref:YtxH-like protein n=1 Tax=Reichenbachiella agarivorans TaxID=2979464 RepID=A0ABY6CJU3_9BACT|nr:hypothetical protein [Reichenbachiella agarivorans]UXP30797.1 hypothetical protein N6H18_10575 [Reichenbachiella agarivorans]